MARADGDLGPAAGSVRGRVRLTGPAPRQKALDRRSDPYCAATVQLDESVVVGRDRGLRNVLVRLAGPLPAAPPPPTAPVRVQQQQCTYTPRVQGLQIGQRLEVQNRDDTLHNVHVYRGHQTVLNRPQKEGGPVVGREVPGPPALLEVKCDVHPWMLGYVWVSPHPWFAVTDEGGSFEIARAPAGRHRLEIWHEVYGTQSVEVDIPAGGAARVDLDVAAAGASPRR